MASIRKRGNRIFLVVSMGYTPGRQAAQSAAENDQAAHGKKQTMMPKSAHTDA